MTNELIQDVNLSNSYKALFDKLKVGSHKNNTVVPCIKGIKYDSCKKKIMIVGRCVNGWKLDGDPNLCIDAYNKLLELHINQDLSWVTEGSAKNKAYFRAVKMILNHEINISMDDMSDWANNIVWSNLYKMAPVSGGNPKKSEYGYQINECDNILKNEITVFHPDVIYFITEKNTEKANNSNSGNWFLHPAEKYEFINTKTYLNELIMNSRIKCYVYRRPESYRMDSYLSGALMHDSAKNGTLFINA